MYILFVNRRLLDLLINWTAMLKITERHLQFVSATIVLLQEDTLEPHVSVQEADSVDGVQCLAKGAGPTMNVLLGQLSEVVATDTAAEASNIVERADEVDECLI